MGIDVENLIIKPAPMRSNRKTNATFTFDGLVDKTEDNPVTVTLSVPTDDPNVSFVNKNGKSVKSISLDPFNFKVGSSDSYPQTIKVNIAGSGGKPGVCDVSLRAVTKIGVSSEVDSFLSYK